MIEIRVTIMIGMMIMTIAMVMSMVFRMTIRTAGMMTYSMVIRMMRVEVV